MKNPFNYLQLASGDLFYDRKDILSDLESRFLSGQTNVVLYGPRRYGKSSLVAELASALEKAGIPCITFDIMKTPTIDLFVSAYATKVYRKLAPVKFRVKNFSDFFKRLRPKVSFNSEGEAGFSFETSDGAIDPEALSEVLDLPQRLVAGEKRVVVAFDEFQEVGELLPDDRFERIMRSVIQGHDHVSYIFLGSRYHMLRRMFTDHNRPFYKSALTVALGKPPFEESVGFVETRFRSAGLDIPSDVAAKLVAKIENIPYFVQQLGFETFRLVDEDSRRAATGEDVDKAYGRLSGLNWDLYEQQMLAFSTAQKKLLIALAAEPTAEFDAAYRARHSLGLPSTVNSAKAKLVENGFIELLDGKCVLADPFFADFLCKV